MPTPASTNLDKVKTAKELIAIAYNYLIGKWLCPEQLILGGETNFQPISNGITKNTIKNACAVYNVDMLWMSHTGVKNAV